MNNTPQLGSTRKVTAFLLLPLTIGGETRWLRKATWVERYGFLHNDDLIAGWVAVRWVE